MQKAHLHLHKNGTARVKFGTGAAFLWHGPDKLSNVNRSGLVFFGTWAFFFTRAETEKIGSLGTGRKARAKIPSLCACSFSFSKWRKNIQKIIVLRKQRTKTQIEALFGQILQRLRC